MTKVFFVLGGNDGEMAVIKTILSMAGVGFSQPKMEWGNHSYNPQDLELGVEPNMKRTPAQGYPSYQDGEKISKFDEVVFVECSPAEWPKGTKAIVVDHHGDRSGEPASILQVIGYLRRLPETVEALNFSSDTRRWIELIAANDAGYIPAMLALGATDAEIARVRAFDRSTQGGITSAHEAEAERAISEKEVSGEAHSCSDESFEDLNCCRPAVRPVRPAPYHLWRRRSEFLWGRRFVCRPQK